MRDKIVQSSVYLFEVITISILIITLYTRLETGVYFNWAENIFTLDFLSTFGIVFAVYQLLIYSLLTLNDGSRIDSLIKIYNLIKHTELSIKYNMNFENVKPNLEELINDKRYMLNDKEIKMLKDIEMWINLFEKEEIDDNIILYKLQYLKNEVEHLMELFRLSWRNSFLLRLVK